jgi:DNA-binding CsgD family transcriptional regulator
VGREPELSVLRQLLESAQDGGSGTLLVHGDPGVGKSALLDWLVGSAAGFQVARATGVEREVDLPYAGLHQLCRSMLATIDALPAPQRQALEVAFGLTSGEPADRHLVGLATLSLLSENAATQPLLCVVDDAHWLDAETTQALAFVARRLGADTVALVVASREHLADLADLPVLHLRGLAVGDARVLLDSVVVGRLDGVVRERFLAETHGNPLAILELPHALTPAEAASGVLRRSSSLSNRIEDSFRARLAELPEQTRNLLVLASAEPLGDPLLLLNAGAQLGLRLEVADPAEEAGLVEIRERCSFRHPLVRSAVYRSATQQERRQAHGALAAATDPQRDPDRRAWHRAQATAALDEDVAAELERGAERAKSRGGLAAAAAFLERAAQLTPDPRARAQRTLAAAEVLFEAGSLDAAGSLIRTLDATRLTDLQAARAERLDAEVSLASCAPGEESAALMRLSAAAEQLRLLDPEAGQAAHLAALRRAFSAATPDVFEAVMDAVSASPASASREVVELLRRGWSQMFTQGYPAGAELLRRATILLRDSPLLDESDLPLLDFGDRFAKTFWDLATWEALTRRFVDVARESGALLNLPRALACLSEAKTAAGEFPAAAAALAEATAVAEATGATGWQSSMMFDALSLDGIEALAQLDRREQAGASSLYLDHARAVVCNALGRYDEALEAAQRSLDLRPLKVYGWAYVELVEAAMRCNETERARDAFELLAVRTRTCGTDWALGLEARCAALLRDDSATAELLYGQAIECLGRTRARPDLARAHLLYGEWLRRDGRRVDAREQLRKAHELCTEMGLRGFAERTRRELGATGETARKRNDGTRADLTAQEAQIARFARDGLTNSQIGAQLFLSPRTVEWHLRHIYPKLGISSRRELHSVTDSI